MGVVEFSPPPMWFCTNEIYNIAQVTNPYAAIVQGLLEFLRSKIGRFGISLAMQRGGKG
jgi:hypothetical protein